MTGPQPTNVRTDLDALASLVTLPRRPLAVQYRKTLLSPAGIGPSDWRLMAVLEYSAADAAKLLAASRPLVGPSPALGDTRWLPKPVRLGLRSARPLDAGAFARLSLRNGALFHIKDTSSFVLILFST